MIGETLAHYVTVRLGIGKPRTQTTESERALLKKNLPGRKRVVEIGVFEGFTTRILAEGSDPDAIVYGVDPFFEGRLGISWGQRISERYNRKHLAGGKVKFVRALSTNVGQSVPEAVDFVFVDGDHSLRGITEDWAFWSGRLVAGGIIALHDTLLLPGQAKEAELGSHQYFRSYIQHDPRFQVVGQVDSLSVLAKRPVT